MKTCKPNVNGVYEVLIGSTKLMCRPSYWILEHSSVCLSVTNKDDSLEDKTEQDKMFITM